MKVFVQSSNVVTYILDQTCRCPNSVGLFVTVTAQFGGQTFKALACNRCGEPYTFPNENAGTLAPASPLHQPRKEPSMALGSPEDSRPETEAQAVFAALPLRMICRAHQRQKKSNKGIFLWSFISDVTMHGSTISRGICQHFGWDPDQDTDKAVLR